MRTIITQPLRIGFESIVSGSGYVSIIYLCMGICKYFQDTGDMPNHALSHDEVLKRVCGVCLRKNLKGLKNISQNYLDLIIKYHHKHYDTTNGNYATVICPSCQKALRDAKSRDKDNKIIKSKLPEVRYGTMRGPRASRSSTTCQCTWCFIWRLNAEGGAY